MSASTAAVRNTAYTTVPLMGLDVAAISERETIDHVLDGVAHQRGGWLCTANLDILRQWHDSTDVRDLIACADLVVADGMPLIWAGGLQGSPLPERVAGSTLVLSLTAAAAHAGASVFLLGGNPGTAESAAAKLTELNPTVRFVGTLCPPFGFENDPSYLAYLVAEIEKAQPDIVYVGLGFPKQERLIALLRGHLHDTWFISCGVSFSFLAGEFRRAPILVQRLGLEWLHRLVQEPRRLFHRYVIDGLPFLVELMWSAVTTRMRTGHASS